MQDIQKYFAISFLSQIAISGMVLCCVVRELARVCIPYWDLEINFDFSVHRQILPELKHRVPIEPQQHVDRTEPANRFIVLFR